VTSTTLAVREALDLRPFCTLLNVISVGQKSCCHCVVLGVLFFSTTTDDEEAIHFYDCQRGFSGTEEKRRFFVDALVGVGMFDRCCGRVPPISSSD
jgi:hypothetical protein